MKRFMIVLLLIITMSFCLSFFVEAEDEVVQEVPIQELKIETNVMVDDAYTKLNFFKKNINEYVEYKKTN